MKFCNNCGKAIDDNAIFCQHCGTRVNGDNPTHSGFNPYGGFGGGYNPYGGYPVYDTRGSWLVTLVSFFSWQIGVIIWLVCRRTRPGKADSAAKGGLVSACMSMPVLGLALYVVWREEPQRQTYARIAGISAIIGAALYAFLFVALVLAGGLTAEMTESVTEGTLAFISLFR